MKAELIDKMGDDLRVVNAARVSFDKESEWGQEIVDPNEYFPLEPGTVCYATRDKLKEADVRLLNFLAREGHWTPFSHVMITMRETVPIFVARQRFKHMVGFTYNEVSRRYVSDEPSFYTPDSWRKAAENKKQGSSDETIEMVAGSLEYYPFAHETENSHMVKMGYRKAGKYSLKKDYKIFLDMAKSLYDHMIASGVAPEQARMVLPQSMYTSYYVTGSLAAWARAYKLRIDPHAQQEIRDLAVQWNDIIGGIGELKYSWSALTEAV